MFTQKKAVELTQKLLVTMAEDERQISGFLNQTGMDVNHIRKSINSPQFLAAFLDYLMGWEPALINACQKADIDPNDVISIRQALDDFHIM